MFIPPNCDDFGMANPGETPRVKKLFGHDLGIDHSDILQGDASWQNVRIGSDKGSVAQQVQQKTTWI